MIGNPDPPAPDPGPTERPAVSTKLDASAIAAARRASDARRRGRSSVVVDAAEPSTGISLPAAGTGLRLP